MSRARNVCSREAGAVAVEAALTLCFVVLPVVFGTISYGYMLSFRQTISQSAAEGARAAAVAPVTADRTAAATHAVDVSMATGSGGLHCGVGYLTCTVSTVPNCGDGSDHDCIKVTVSYPYRDHSLLPTVPGLGFTLPSSVTYSAMAEIS
ncbi:MAG TPA: TadE/TadG family type IV pilus assembly protein [Marmoricola sp.]|nr:TadE/TadG family type IV pilus assembly protein [Marmoricola sp.]